MISLTIHLLNSAYIIMIRSLAVALSVVVGAAASVNQFPIVGVFTQPTSDSDPACGGDCLYLAASYVK